MIFEQIASHAYLIRLCLGIRLHIIVDFISILLAYLPVICMSGHFAFECAKSIIEAKHSSNMVLIKYALYPAFFVQFTIKTTTTTNVEQATDASLDSENWALNMEICDMINESSDSARDAMKAIRKRLSQNAGKNYTVIMYTLTVLETCVKNCGKAFHMLVANKEFIQDLVKLIGPKNDPPTAVQEKVLNLIQIWADAFKSQPDLSGVVQVYQELKSKGIEFPVADLDAIAPIYTPQRVSDAHTATTACIHSHKNIVCIYGPNLLVNFMLAERPRNRAIFAAGGCGSIIATAPCRECTGNAAGNKHSHSS